MIIASKILSFILPLMYLGATFFYGFTFIKRNKKFETKSITVVVLLLLSHLLHFILRGFAIGNFPLASKYDALSFLAFSILTVYLFIEIKFKIKTTIFLALILGFLIQLFSSIFYTWDVLPQPLLINPIYLVHVTLTIFGYSGICISALFAVLYILLNHDIKHHRLRVIFDKLPALTFLEQISIRAVQVGIIFLGLGIIMGHLMAGAVLGTYWPIDAKVIFSNIIWFGYFIGYIIAQVNKWRGRWMAYLSILGFGIFIIANITIIFIDNTFHQFL